MLPVPLVSEYLVKDFIYMGWTNNSSFSPTYFTIFLISRVVHFSVFACAYCAILSR